MAGGPKYGLDDDGHLYMHQNPETKQWELMPDKKYILNGYEYDTDSNGNIVKVSGELRIKDDGRLPLNAKLPDMGEDDDRGHLIADMFGGDNTLGNLVPQLSELNRGAYKSLEMKLSDALANGHKVQVNIQPYYNADTHRPYKLIYGYSIDGHYNEIEFDNEMR